MKLYKVVIRQSENKGISAIVKNSEFCRTYVLGKTVKASKRTAGFFCFRTRTQAEKFITSAKSHIGSNRVGIMCVEAQNTFTPKRYNSCYARDVIRCINANFRHYGINFFRKNEVSVLLNRDNKDKAIVLARTLTPLYFCSPRKETK